MTVDRSMSFNHHHCRALQTAEPSQTKKQSPMQSDFSFFFSFAICYWYWLHRCVREEFWGHMLRSGDNVVRDQEVRSHLCLISHHCRESKKWADTLGSSGDLIGLCGCGGGGWGRGRRREKGSSLPVLGGALRRRPQTVVSPPSRVSPWPRSRTEERERMRRWRRRGWGAEGLWSQSGCSRWAESTEVPVNAFVRPIG